MKQKLKQAGKEIGLIVLFSMGLCLILTLAALVRSLLGSNDASGALAALPLAEEIILLLSSGVLLSADLPETEDMKAWTEIPMCPLRGHWYSLAQY